MPPAASAHAAVNAARRELAAYAASLAPPVALYPQYKDDPLGFIRDVLKVTLSADAVSVVLAMLEHYRVLTSAGHSVGKSFLAACLVLWWHYTRDCGICITTAPTDRQVKSILWKEVRALARRAGLPRRWAGPKVPRLETTPDHYATGYAARDATRFQGHHAAGGVFVIFDEAEGIEAEFYEALKTMLDDESYFVAIYNPTGGSGTATHAAEQQADDHGMYARRRLSCLTHPNITGDGPEIRGAITLDQLKLMLLEDSTPLGPTDAPADGDVTLPTGERFRPGPVAQARCLGIRPLLSTAGVWSELLWQRMRAVRHDIQPDWPVQLGCDVARYGDCNTVIVVRKGYCLLHAEVHSKVPTDFTATRLKEVCHQFSDAANPEKQIPALVDEGGVGGGVIDQAGDHLFIAVNASKTASNPRRFSSVRSELWWTARDAAVRDCLDVSRLPAAILTRLRQELLAAEYRYLPNGKIRVEEKEDVVEKLRRSPDLADAWNLSIYIPRARAA